MPELQAPEMRGSTRPAAAGQLFRLPKLTERLGAAELRRRAWHISPGVLAYILCLVPHEDPMTVTCQVILLGITLVLSASIVYQYATIARRGERRASAAAVLGYALSVLGTLLLFPGQSELGMTVLAVLAFGDGFATLGGLVFRGPALPWNRAKTWSGTICFVAGGTPMAALMYWGESQPRASIALAFACAGSATFVAAIAESLPMKLNDNIRVGITASVTIIAVHGMLAGWA